jgi:hypothetical protein
LFARTAGVARAVVGAMDPHAYLMALAIGSALVGLWVTVRLERATPKTGKGAGLCFLAAWIVAGLAGPLSGAALLYLPVGLALLATVFPVLAATFALTAFPS